MKKYLSIVFVFFIILISCTDQTNLIIKPNKQYEKVGSDIVESKLWFEKYFLKNYKSSRTQKKREHKVNWDKAEKSKFSNNAELIIIPIETTIEGKIGNNKSHMWIYKNKEKKEIVKIVDFATAEGENETSSLWNFSGLMTMREYDGELDNGFIFDKGNAIGVTAKIENEEPKWKINSKKSKINDYICQYNTNITIICTNYYYRVCSYPPNSSVLDCEAAVFNFPVCTLNSGYFVNCTWQNSVGTNSVPSTGTGPTTNSLMVPPAPDPDKLNCLQLSNLHGESSNTIMNLYNNNYPMYRDALISQRANISITGLESQPGGPTIRYIVDPLNPKVIIDLRHMLVIGYYGKIVGESVEVFQWLSNNESGMDHQDYYSNQLGYTFYTKYGQAIRTNPREFLSFLVTFLNSPWERDSLNHPNNVKCP
jgi:hypothetical protein